MGVFSGLGDKLKHVFTKLTSRGKLDEYEIKQAMREIRIALLEADVNFNVVKDFVARISERAKGEEITKSVTPGQQVVKIVHDELVELMGAKNAKLETLDDGTIVMVMCANADAVYDAIVAALAA